MLIRKYSPYIFLISLCALQSAFPQGYWFQQYTPTNHELHDIKFLNKNLGWAVGENGTILKTTNGGTNWAKIPPNNIPTTAILYEVFFYNDQFGFACGETGIFIKTTDGGATWTIPNPIGLPPNNFYGMYFQTKDLGWVCGGDGSVQRTTNAGLSWNLIYQSASYTLYDIIKAQDTLYACGNNGRFIRSGDNGSTFTTHLVPGGPNLKGLSFVGLQRGFVTAEDTVYETTNMGNTWIPHSVGTIGKQFNAISMVNGNIGWTIATGQDIRFTDNGGSTWTNQVSPSANVMNAICTFTDAYAWACGGNGDIIKFTMYPPRISTATELDFGSLLCEGEVIKRLTVRNIGNGPLDIYTAEILGAGNDKFEFILTSPASFPVMINANDSLIFIIKWKPFAVGTKSAYLELSHNDVVHSPTDVQFLARKDSTDFSLSSIALNYPQTCVGDVADRSLDLTAEGTESILLESITKISGDDEFTLYAPQLPFSIAPQQHQPISIRFTPTSAGNYSAVFRVTTQPCNRQQTFTVNGNAIETRLVTFPEPMFFGDAVVGTTLTKSVTLSNPGPTNANLTSIGLSGTTTGLTITSQPLLPSLLKPNEQRSITISFNPQDTITLLDAQVCIQWDKVCAGSKCIPIFGRGIINPHIIIPPVKVFPTLLCENFVYDTVKIENTGSGPLTITSAQVEGKDAANFTLIDVVVPITINSGETFSMLVQFAASDAGDKGARLRLTHNDAQNNPTEIPLIGKKELVGFRVLGDTVNTIKACVGTVTKVSYLIENVGSVPMKITDIQTTVTNNAPLILKGVTTPFIIASGTSQLIDVEFAPTQPESYTALFTIRGELCGIQHILRVEAIGMKSSLTAANLIDFGTVQIGGSVPKTALVTNSGNVGCEIGAASIAPPVPGMTLITPPATPFTLDTSASKNYSIQFTPTTDGVFDTYLVFVVTKECPDTIRIPIRASATSSSITLNRSRIDAALSPCAQVAQCDSLRISNPSTNILTLHDLGIFQSQQTFGIANKPTLPFIIQPNGELTLLICSSLPAAGADSARFYVQSSDLKKPVIEIPIAARRDSIGLFLSKQQLDFGAMTQCDAPRIVSFAVTNSGTKKDTLTIEQPADASFIVNGSLQRILPSGDSTIIDVRYAPAAFGKHTSTLRILSSKCSREKSIPLTGSKAASKLEASATQVSFSDVVVNTSVTKYLDLIAKSSTSMNIERVYFTPSSVHFSSTQTFPIKLDSGVTTSLPISFTPDSAQPFSSRLCIVIASPCADTICIDLTGNGIKSNLTFSATQLFFGERAQCEIANDSIVCTNKGLSPVTITASSITGIGKTAFLLLDPTTTNETLQANESRIYHIQFIPALVADGTQSAALHLETFDVQAASLDIPLEGKRITQSLASVSPIDFGVIEIGSTQRTTLTIRNSGTALYNIARSGSSAPFSIQAQLPVTLKVNDSISIDLSFNPIDTSSITSRIVLYVDTPCRDSIVILVSGKGKQGAVQQTAEMHYGIVPTCSKESEICTITNSSTETIMLRSLAIAGIDSSLFSFQSKPSLPLPMLPNTKLDVTIIHAPDALGAPTAGRKQAELTTIITRNGKDETRTTRLLSDVAKQTLTMSAVDFGQVQLGQIGSRSTRISNSSAFPVHVKAITVSDASIIIQKTTPALPINLQPGEFLDVDLTFTPQIVQSYAANLLVEIDSPCVASLASNLHGEGIPTNMTQASLTIGTLHGKIDEIIEIPVMLDTDVSAAQVTAFGGEISFNRTMLYPLGVKRDGTLSRNMILTMKYEHAKGIVNIDASGGSIASGVGTLLLLQCKVLLGNDVETPLTMTPMFDFTQGNARVMKRTNGIFQLEGYCRAGDRLLRIDGNFSLRQNNPNPFSIQSAPTTKIEYEIAHDGYASLTLYDAMGREIRRLVDAWKNAGSYVADVHADDLPAGMYFYTLRSGKFFSTKKMIVAK